MKRLLTYSIFILLLISTSCQNVASAKEIGNSPKEITFWIMPNEPIGEKNPTKDEISEFAEEYNLTFEITDPCGEYPRYIGNGSHIVIVDLNIVDWASVIGQVFILKEIDIFENVHPNIKIKLKVIGWGSAHGEFLKAYDGRCSPPDVLQIPSTWTAEFADKNVFERLNDNVEEDIDMGLQHYYACSLWSCRIESFDTLYAIPWFLDVRAMYYWKDIFNETNITEDNIGRWGTFKDACEKIRGHQFDNRVYAFGIPGGTEGKEKEWILVHNIIPWVYGRGGKIITHKPSGERELGLSEEKTRNGLMYYIDLSLEQYTGPGDFNSTSNEIDEGFVNKKYAMVYSGQWLLKKLKHLDEEGRINIEDVGTALPPAGRAGTYTFVGGSNLAIWQHRDDNFDEGWEFINFLSSDKESQKRYANATLKIPASREALEDYTEINPLLKPFKDALVAGYGKSFPSISEWGEIECLLADDLNSIWKITGNETFTPDERKSIVERKLKEIDGDCYWMLNPDFYKKKWLTKILIGLKTFMREIISAFIGAVIGYAFNHIVSKKRSDKRISDKRRSNE